MNATATPSLRAVPDAPAAPAAPPAIPAVIWAAFAALAMGQLLVDIDDVVLNIALPSIAADVGLTADTVPWAVNAYLLCFGGFLLLGGRLADRYGHRAVLLVGVGIFCCASLIGTIAHTPGAVIGSRAGQGLAAALLAPAAMSLLMQTFPNPSQRARALGLWGAVTGTGAVLGLVVGGVVTEYVGWRWIFGGNAAVAAVVGISVLVLLPGGTGDRRIRIEPTTAVLATGSLLSLVWALHDATGHGWGSSNVVGWLLVAVVAGAVCVKVSTRSSAPLVPASLVRNRAVVVANVSGLLVGAALMGTFFFVSLHLQQVLGYSPLHAAWSYLPLVGGLVVAAGAGSALLPRTGSRPVLVAGMVGCAKGLVLLALLGIGSGHSAFATSLLPGLVLVGLGLGLSFVGLTSAAVPGGEGATDGGVASGLYNTSVQVGGALGLALLTSVATSRSDALVAAGRTLPRALEGGRDLALFLAAAMLVVGAGLAMLMPRDAGRSA
jgi:EmrB/QacA subfamily drug resistance transporter